MCDCLVAAQLPLAAAALLHFADNQAHIESAVSLLSGPSLQRFSPAELPFAECVWAIPLLEMVIYVMIQTKEHPAIVEQLKATMRNAPQHQQGGAETRAAVPEDEAEGGEVPQDEPRSNALREECGARLTGLLVQLCVA
jgi:hypothetical protein